MARSSTPAVVTFLVVTAFIASPHILQNYPQTAPLASALTWMGEKFMQGIASLTFAVAVMTFCVLVSDAREWLTGVSATEISPTPEALEEGTAPKFQHELDVLEAEVAGADPPTLPEPVRITIIGKIFSLVANTLFFVYAFSKEELAPTLPENATIFALFILRGLEVLFVILLILIAMVLLVARRAGTDTIQDQHSSKGTGGTGAYGDLV
ncbi:hypothetical protein C8J57DRAFT_492385 [Mycena rebaudengoi]|nr:hypothetical protein C8J57DRAFT_492385 [Mycena rebaudengoi]